MAISHSWLLSSAYEIIDPDDFDLTGSMVGILTHNLVSIPFNLLNQFFVLAKFFTHFVQLKLL